MVSGSKIGMIIAMFSSIGSLEHCTERSVEANFNKSSNFNWVGAGDRTPYSANDLLRGGLKSSEVLYMYNECNDAISNFSSLEKELQQLHNNLVLSRNQPPLSSETNNFITYQEQPAFYISFFKDSISAGGGVELQIAETAQASVEANVNDTNIKLAVASIESEVSLTPKAMKCFKRNACDILKRSTAGGEAEARSKEVTSSKTRVLKSVLYGNSLILKLKNAQRSGSSSVSANVKQFSGKVTFNLDKRNVSVEASYFGSIKDLDDYSKVASYLKKRYDIDELISDLNNIQVVNVMDKWKRLSDKRNVVALIYEDVKTEDCAAN